MCLLVLAWRTHPRYRLIVAANRDEFHERPSEPLARWASSPDILAGRDLRAGGTWLAVDGSGRFGVITNFRDLQRPRHGAPSRGTLIPDYLGQSGEPEAFLEALAPQASGYSGFNLLLADAHSLSYASNRSEPFSRQLPPGIHGLSNHLLDSPWPKLLRVRERFEQLLRVDPEPEALFTTELFAMLADREPAPHDTGAPTSLVPADLERALSAPFVLHPTYGTRCSTVMLQSVSGATRISECSYDASGEPTGEVTYRIAPAALRSGP